MGRIFLLVFPDCYKHFRDLISAVRYQLPYCILFLVRVWCKDRAVLGFRSRSVSLTRKEGLKSEKSDLPSIYEKSDGVRFALSLFAKKSHWERFALPLFVKCEWERFVLSVFVKRATEGNSLFRSLQKARPRAIRSFALCKMSDLRAIRSLVFYRKCDSLEIVRSEWPTLLLFVFFFSFFLFLLVSCLIPVPF